jgi:voltage-gated sodium channel
MQKTLDKIAHSTWFSTFIIGVILLAGVLVGVETYHDFAERHYATLHFLDKLVLWIFVVEAVIKMGAHGTKPWRYFKDPWNCFDFAIVAVCFMPVGAQFVAVLRLARILRVLRLVTALPKLQVLVGALLKSIPSMGYVSLLLFLLFYIYAVMATFLFAGNDPFHFGSLERSMLSLFRVVTLEDWTDVMYIQMYGSEAYGVTGGETVGPAVASVGRPIFAALFFVSFVLFGTMIILNLFIGVIMNGMDEVRREEYLNEMAATRRQDKISLHDEISLINEQLANLQKHATWC